MEVISFPNSSLLNVKESSSSEKKKRKKKRKKNQAIEFGNAESKETETCLGTDSKLDSEANVENSLTKDADLVVESKVNVSLESNSLMKGTISGGDLNVETVENNIGLESALKGSGLNEQQEHADRKGKRKRKRKKEQKEGPESVVELRDVKGNSLIDDKQSGSNLESGLEGVQLKGQPDDSERKRESMKERKEGVESIAELRDLKGNSLIDEKHTGSKLEPGLEGVQLKEKPADYEGKRKRWRKRKMAKAGQFEKMDEKSVVEMSDGKEKSVIDEKQSDFHLESKVNVSLESGLKEGANSFVKDAPLERDSYVEVLEKISSESGFKGSQLNEQPVGSKRKRKKKRNHKLAIDEQCRKLDAESVLALGDSKENSLINEKQRDCHVEPKLSVSLESGLKEGANSDLGTLNNISLESGLKGTQLNEQTVQLLSKRQRKRKKQKMKRLRGDKYISSKRNDRDSSEAENKNMCTEPQRDPPQSASTDMVETQNLHVDRDLVLPEMEAIPSLSHGKGSYPFSVKENSLIDEKQRDCHTESKVSVSLESGLKEEANSDLGTLNNISLLKGTQLNEQMVQLESKRQRKKQKMQRLRQDKDISSKRNDRDGSEAENKNICPEPQSDPPQSASTEMVETQNLHVDRDLVLPEMEVIPSLSNLAGVKDDVALKATAEQNSLSQTLYSSIGRIGLSGPKKKLLVLDLNGILVDVVQKPDGLRPSFRVSKKAVFKRPFVGDFLHFCFSTFNVAIWSSRTYKNVNKLVHRLMAKRKCNLLFCWHRRQCTITKFKTIEDKKKPIVLKELRKLWEKHEGNLTWGKGEFDESNTLLLDDSPYKALRNPANTAVFPCPYQYKDAGDSSLGPDGDIRKYLEGLAAAENVQTYVEQNPFGQPAITESNPHWDFYSQIIDYKK